MKRRLHLTFPETIVQEPIIHELGRRFDVVTNIRRANVEESFGWVILELDGTEQALGKALEYLHDRGVKVDPIDGDVVEG